MLKKRLYSLTVFIIAVFAFYSVSYANGSGGVKNIKNDKCPDSFPTNLITDICYKCFFPLKLGDITIFNYGDMKDPSDVDSSDIKKGISNFFSNLQQGNLGNKAFSKDDSNPSDIVCTCPASPLPEVGLTISFWAPLKVGEMIMKPNCFPFLFGAQLDFGPLNFGSTAGTVGMVNDEERMSTYNTHVYLFPLLEILGALGVAKHCTESVKQFDLLYISELDPTHPKDTLSAIINPEVFLFANPVSIAACSIDAVSASFGYPLNPLFWCAGSWGLMYPLTGNTKEIGSPPSVTSQLLARALFKMGRLHLESNTSTKDAMCGESVYMPILKKSQYRFQTLFPVPETSGKCCHELGKSTFLWGEWRNIPSKEYYIYLIWKKKICCLIIL